MDVRTAPLVFASDAAGPSTTRACPAGAWAISAARFNSDEVAAVSRRRELHARGPLEDASLLPSIQVGDSRLPAMPTTVVPTHWLGGAARWFLLQARKYCFMIHINRGEFKAVNAVLAAACAGGVGPGARLVDLGDSRGTCGAWSK